MTTAPALDSKSFGRLAGTDKEEAERRFSSVVAAFHEFLNCSRVTAGIQSRRASWASPRSSEAFANRKFEPEHWYTFNVGGRSEAQLNLGMFPTHMRIGMGFEFTEREHGDPKQVRQAFVRLYHAIHARRNDFEEIVATLPAELELYPGRGGALQIVPATAVVETILDLPREPQWLFVGRLLRPGVDDDILEDGQRLGQEIERVFSRIIAWWEQANGAG